ncbi:MAG: flagellar hook protein FlgE [Acidobacteria bacterium]|nr:flagellar hook protein FlgE [Acidobacteriota bacterium]
MALTFSTALSGLSAHSTAIDVVGNNLANLNTVGFKGSTASFQDLVSQSIGAAGSNNQVGLGVNRPGVFRGYTQGSIQLSNGPLDAAIQGDGFFVARNSTNQLLLTRAGNFQVDASGNLLTANGDRVQGWGQTAGVLNTTGPVGNITLPFGVLRMPVATTKFSISGNLNAATANTGKFAAPVEVIDSLGTSHVVTVTFTKTGNNAWDYKVTAPGEEVTGGTAGTPSELATGSLTFDSAGKLTSPAAGASGSVTVNFRNLANGAADMEMKWDLYTADRQPMLTQISQASAVSGTNQNGSQAAQIAKVGVADGGQIVATYSNGQQSVIAQLALASVVNPESLVSIGDNEFQLGSNTSAPAIGLPDTGGRGKVMGEALEASNVDLAREFTNLIIYQRGYQANSRVITTLDELSQETNNLKR